MYVHSSHSWTRSHAAFKPFYREAAIKIEFNQAINLAQLNLGLIQFSAKIIRCTETAIIETDAEYFWC